MLSLWDKVCEKCDYKPFFDSVCIVIQGPLHKNSLSRVERYKEIGKVIVSHWSSDDISLMDNVDMEGVDIVCTDMPLNLWNGEGPADPNRIYNKQNVYLQCITTLQGLKMANSRYVIKTRSDEYYYDIKNIYTKARMKQKLVTSNVVFRKDSVHKFHASDHLMCDKTIVMMDAFTRLKKKCEGKIKFDQKLSAEQLIILSILWARSAPADMHRSRRIMKRHVDVIRVENLGSHEWSESGKFGSCSANRDDIIHSMEEL
tara:strand:- start:2974 stop:3747 length:774 start_codon:yes stop_codon:yes gene_type:complete